MKGTGALAVQTKVLGKRLGDASLKALLDEIANSPGIARQVARRKALVSTVKEWEVAAFADHSGDLLPLVLRRVDAGGVVGAGVQHDDGSRGGGGQGGQHAVNVKPLGLGGKVRVLFNGEPDIAEDLVVVCPGRVRQVHGRAAWVEFGEEKRAQVDGPGA